MMKAAIRFCGGCNPYYDRKEMAEHIAKMFPDVHFMYAEEGGTYDHLIVLHGCMAQCPDLSSYTVEGTRIDITPMTTKDDIINELKEKLK